MALSRLKMGTVTLDAVSSLFLLLARNHAMDAVVHIVGVELLGVVAAHGVCLSDSRQILSEDSLK